MVRERGLFKLDNPWPRIGWWSTAGLLGVAIILGFVVLGREQQNGPARGTWTAICRALGITADTGPAGEPQPPLRTPTEVAWTSATLTQVRAGNVQRGAALADGCVVCHGDQGVSRISFIPKLAGMDAVVIFKQLDDYRSGKRVWAAMNSMAGTLGLQDFADVAAYLSSRTGCLLPISGEGIPESGHGLRQRDTAIRLVFAGDPGRGIPPCAACHGPAGHKLGAPELEGQHTAYIELQLASFADGSRQNDINEQMRTIAVELTPDEIRKVANYYANTGAIRIGSR